MPIQLLIIKMNHIAHAIGRTPIERRLYVLAMAHFILASLAGAVSALSLISAVAFSTSMAGLTGGTLGDTFSFYWFLGTGTSAACLMLSVFVAAAGWNLLVRRWRKLELILEVATLFLVPFGTILGIATLIVLAQRPMGERLSVSCEPAKAQ